MAPKPLKPFETAIFTNAMKRDPRNRWALMVFLLACLAVVYWVVRDIVYQRIVYRYAQGMFNDLASAADNGRPQLVDGRGDFRQLVPRRDYQLKSITPRMFLPSRMSW